MYNDQSSIPSQTPTPQPYYLEPKEESKTSKVVKKTGRAFYLGIQLFIGLAMFGILLYLFVLPINIVDGQSMQPNFCDKDVYFTYKLDSYFQRNPYKRGDVIAFKKDANSNLIKRIVGMPGDRIRLQFGKVYINDVLFEEPYLQSTVITGSGDFEPTDQGKTYIVPAGKYFAIGDNRPFSSDSRDIGPIDPIENQINGKVILVFWPLNKFRVFDPNQKYAKDACGEL